MEFEQIKEQIKGRSFLFHYFDVLIYIPSMELVLPFGERISGGKMGWISKSKFSLN